MIINVTRDQWDEFYKRFPNAHFLQSGAWGDLKSRFGWKAVRIVEGESGAQILFRYLPLGYSIAYLAKGPIGEGEDIYRQIDQVCRANKAIFLKIEPDRFESDEPFKAPLPDLKPSKPIQPRRTVVVSLEGSEEDILNRMKQKTRYNIRLAEKKGVVVKSSADIAEFHRMALATAQRDAFGVHNLSYYQSVYELFHPERGCELLMAYYDNKPLAALFVLRQGENAYYLYGASLEVERNRMPTYLIQWEAMKWARQQGCRWYDLWGIPDLDEEELETQFQVRQSHDGLWGVYRFKRGFGGEVKRSIGAWDKVYQAGLYNLYSGYLRLRGGQAD